MVDHNTKSSGSWWLYVRSLLYCVAFLALVLVALPWLCMKLDPYLPQLPSAVLLLLRIVGVVVLLVTGIWYFVCSWHLIDRGRGPYVEFDPPTKLVITGPYRWVRNPVATGVLGMLLGVGLVTGSVAVLLLFAVAVVLAHLQVRFLEEPLLHQRFGDDYRQYCARVPRWIPRRPKDHSCSSKNIDADETALL